MTLFETPAACRHGRNLDSCPFCNTRSSDPGTSFDAAAKALLNSPLRHAIYATHLAHPYGMTDDELETQLTNRSGHRPHHGSLTKRRGDLVKLGLLEDTGDRRLTRTGCKAIVWGPT